MTKLEELKAALDAADVAEADAWDAAWAARDANNAALDAYEAELKKIQEERL
jgi:hypothetical protein